MIPENHHDRSDLVNSGIVPVSRVVKEANTILPLPLAPDDGDSDTVGPLGDQDLFVGRPANSAFSFNARGWS
jgi:hypothetical protein